MARTKAPEKIELNMTAMIDVVFMLLAFFIMTFKIVAPEGDFSVKMPLGQSSSQSVETNDPIQVRLSSDASGHLANITLAGQPLGDNFNQLRARIHKLSGVGDAPTKASDLIVELDPDNRLRYEYTIDAITAVSGFTRAGRTYPLVENIRFTARPKSP